MRLARGSGAACPVVKLGHRCPRIILAGARGLGVAVLAVVALPPIVRRVGR
jgi:hypothetical protein